jgi:hypothetical protein
MLLNQLYYVADCVVYVIFLPFGFVAPFPCSLLSFPSTGLVVLGLLVAQWSYVAFGTTPRTRIICNSHPLLPIIQFLCYFSSVLLSSSCPPACSIFSLACLQGGLGAAYASYRIITLTSQVSSSSPFEM